MLNFLHVAYNLLTLCFSCLGLFLSLWIVIPAPTRLLLPLGVGAPEVSPWLFGLNAIACLLSLSQVRRHPWFYAAFSLGLVGLLLSTLPLLQLPAANQQAAAAMRQTLGADYLTRIPGDIHAQMRPQPFLLLDALKGIDPGQSRYTSGIPFATAEGMPLKLDIYQPLQPGKYPALVVIYGGSWQTGSPVQDVEFSRYMAARGYVVFAIDYRHAPRYRFPAQLQDVRAALDFVRQQGAQYGADPSRLALLGRSAGAHLALMAAYQADALPIRAVVSYYGPVDLLQGYRSPPQPDPLNVRAVLEAFLGGPPEVVPTAYRDASPISYVTRPLPPTLLVYGKRDHIVQSYFGRQLYERLKSVPSPAVWLEIPWAEHAFDAIFFGPSNQLALYYTERFLAWALQTPS